MGEGAETRLVKRIRARLSELGWTSWKNHGSHFSQSGLPDIMAVKGGRLLAIEAKISPNKPTKLQQATLDKLARHGAITVVAYSLADVEAVLTAAAVDDGETKRGSNSK